MDAQSFEDLDTSLCLKSRKWHIFLLSSIGTFLVLLVLVGGVRLLKQLFCKSGHQEISQESSCLFSKLVPGESITGVDSTLGKINVVINFFLSMFSLAIFFLDAFE